MFENLSEYWHTAGEFTSPLSIAGAVIWTMLFAVLGITLVLILCRKLILVKRRHVLLKVLGISYFIFIPALTLFFSFKWGMAHGLHRDLKAHLGTYTKHLDKAFGEQVSRNMKLQIAEDGSNLNTQMSANDAVDTLTNVLFRNYVEMLKHNSETYEGIKGKAASLLFRLFTTENVAATLKASIRALVQKSIGADEKLTRNLMNARLETLLKEGILTQIIALQIDRLFNGLKKSILLTYLLILLFPVLEIALAHWLIRRDKARAYVPEIRPGQLN